MHLAMEPLVALITAHIYLLYLEKITITCLNELDLNETWLRLVTFRKY